MASEHLSPRQFSPPGDDSAKAALIKQLRENFRKKDLAWLLDDSIRVDAPKRIDKASIDWSDYDEWRASRQLKEVRKIAKKIEKHKDKKPAVIVERPNDTRVPMDGHHHILASVDHKDNPLAFLVHVDRQSGPWDTLHDKQSGDDKKDDFGKTSKFDRKD